MSGDKSAAASGEATLERRDDVALAKLVRARAQEPTIRVGQDDFLKPEETSGGCDAMKVEEMQGNYKINPDLIGRVRRKGVTHQDEKSGWRLATLGEFVANRTRGIVPNKTPDTTFELFSVPSLDTGAPEIVRGKEVGSNKQIVDEGTVLLCKINPRINRSWVVSSHTAHQKIASTEWITFPPNEAFEPKYLSYYLKQDSVRDFLAANASGVGGSLMRVKPTTLRDYPFPLAPLDQQKRIVAEIEKQFSRLDEAVANLKRVKANLKRYKAAVLKAAVEGRLVETEAELARREGRSYETGAQLLQRILETCHSQWQGKGKYKKPAAPDTTSLPELPEGWVWATVDRTAQIISGLTKNPKREALPSKYPYLRVANVYANELRLNEIEHIGVAEAELEKLRLQRNDLLVVEGNGSPDQIGRVALWDGSIPNCMHQNHIIKVRFSDVLLPKWAMNWLLSPGGRHQIEQVSSSTSGLHTLSTGKVARLPVPLPPIAEQHRIVAEVDRRLTLLRATEDQVVANLRRSEGLRNSVLARAFSIGIGL
ncbi:restriction endonuclease subunit S [Acidithiobacillus sulfuriphilus]|uniref:restriction endonuclease subunit S n=1 Tax=Acidithiobacillus sulfuriphilus TaxID=1867749 RepID=UPI003F61500D